MRQQKESKCEVLNNLRESSLLDMNQEIHMSCEERRLQGEGIPLDLLDYLLVAEPDKTRKLIDDFESESEEVSSKIEEFQELLSKSESSQDLDPMAVPKIPRPMANLAFRLMQLQSAVEFRDTGEIRKRVRRKIEEYKATLETCSNPATVKRKIANLYDRIEDFREAAKLYEEIAASEENTWTCYNLGTLHLEAGNKDTGRRYLMKALRHDPDNIMAQYNLGVSYMGEDDDKAAEQFQQVITKGATKEGLRLSNAIEYAHNNLGVCYYRTISNDLEAVEKASEEFDKAGFSGDHNAMLMIEERFRIGAETQEDIDIKIPGMIGHSRKMQELRTRIKRVASSDRIKTVLIMGESGTGKEIASKAMHYFNSKRCKGGFKGKYEDIDGELITINCPDLRPDTGPAILYGTVGKIFTGVEETKGVFEVHNGGTVILDEIADLPLECQAQLLRVIQSGEFQRVGGKKTIKTDVRIVAVTNKGLTDQVAGRKFRQELLNRLEEVIIIVTPPLNDHNEDIPYLVRHFRDKYTTEGEQRKSISRSVINALQNHDWKDKNVRRLEGVVKYLIDMVDTEVIYPEHLPDDIRGDRKPTRDRDLEDILTREEFIEILNRSGLKQEEFGQRVRASRVHISYIKNGRRNMSQELSDRIRKEFGHLLSE